MKKSRDEKLGRMLADAVRKSDSGTVCPEIDLIAAAIEGTLPEAELEALRAHLAVCPRCLDVYGTAHALLHGEAGSATTVAGWKKAVGALAAVAAVALLAIRLTGPNGGSSEERQKESAPRVARAPVVPPSPEKKASDAAGVAGKQRQPHSAPPTEKAPVMLAFADADAFWQAAADAPLARPRFRVRGFLPHSSAVTESADTKASSAAAPVRSNSFISFRIGVGIAQMDAAVAAKDRAATEGRIRFLAALVDGYGWHDRAVELRALVSGEHMTLGEWAIRCYGIVAGRSDVQERSVQLGRWAEQVRASLGPHLSAQAQALAGAADRLLPDQPPPVQSDLAAIRYSLTDSKLPDAERETRIRNLLRDMAAHL